MPTHLYGRSVAIFEPGCGTAVVCALNAHCLESEDVWPLPIEIRTPRSTGWRWCPGFPTIPRKDSGLVRSVSLALGSHSQNRRLCSPSTPDAVIASCLPFAFAPQAPLRASFRQLAITAVGSNRFAESLSVLYYRLFGKPPIL